MVSVKAAPSTKGCCYSVSELLSRARFTKFSSMCSHKITAAAYLPQETLRKLAGVLRGGQAAQSWPDTHRRLYMSRTESGIDDRQLKLEPLRWALWLWLDNESPVTIAIAIVVQIGMRRQRHIVVVCLDV